MEPRRPLFPPSTDKAVEPIYNHAVRSLNPEDVFALIVYLTVGLLGPFFPPDELGRRIRILTDVVLAAPKPKTTPNINLN